MTLAPSFEGRPPRPRVPVGAVTRVAPLLCLLALAATAATAAQAAPGERFRILYAERAEFDDQAARAEAGGDVAGAGAATRTKRTRFDAYGRRFDLALERNDRVLGANATRVDVPEVWRGTLTGLDGSWVRLTVANGRRHGMIWDGRELYVIEPAADAKASLVGPTPASGDAPIVYRLSDTLAPAGGAYCGVATLPGASGAAASRTGLDAYRQMVGELQQSADRSLPNPSTSAADANPFCAI